MEIKPVELVLSTVIALVALTVMIVFPSPRVPPLLVVTSLLGALGAIYFSSTVGNYTGPVRGGYIDTPTPSGLVKAIGWILLILITASILVRSLEL
ncbi:MAG: hypothetical protein U0795_25460 [Pirellulales bacterium]